MLGEPVAAHGVTRHAEVMSMRSADPLQVRFGLGLAANSIDPLAR